jgi:hypothetical protein
VSAQETATVGHITLTAKSAGVVDAVCDYPGCGIGITVPPKFGFIPQDVMLAEWAKQHTHTQKGKK